jgi:hypothetical protein
MRIEPLSRGFASSVVNRLFAAFGKHAPDSALEANTGDVAPFKPE